MAVVAGQVNRPLRTKTWEVGHRGNADGPVDHIVLFGLLRLAKQLRLAGRRLVLLEPSRAVKRALKLMGLENFFLEAADILEARQLIQDRALEENRSRRHEPADPSPVVPTPALTPPYDVAA